MRHRQMNGVAFFVVMASTSLAGCSGNTNTVTEDSTPTENAVEATQEDPALANAEAGDYPNPPVAEGAFQAKIPPAAADVARFTTDLGEGTLRAKIKTNQGDLNCTLYEEESPITVANFVGLSRGLKAWTNEGGEEMLDTPLYDDVLCHRVIPEFMIQCGDPTGTGSGGPGYQIPDEFASGLKHDKPGLLSMANAGPNTGGSQFFVTEVPTPHLNDKHTVFGECAEVDLIKQIARVERDNTDRPTNDIVIETIDIYRD